MLGNKGAAEASISVTLALQQLPSSGVTLLPCTFRPNKEASFVIRFFATTEVALEPIPPAAAALPNTADAAVGR